MESWQAYLYYTQQPKDIHSNNIINYLNKYDRGMIIRRISVEKEKKGGKKLPSIIKYYPAILLKGSMGSVKIIKTENIMQFLGEQFAVEQKPVNVSNNEMSNFKRAFLESRNKTNQTVPTIPGGQQPFKAPHKKNNNGPPTFDFEAYQNTNPSREMLNNFTHKMGTIGAKSVVMEIIERDPHAKGNNGRPPAKVMDPRYNGKK